MCAWGAQPMLRRWCPGPGLRITTGAASTLLPFTAIPLQSHRALHMHRWHGPLLIMALQSSCSLPRRSRTALELLYASARSSRSCFYFHWFTCSFTTMSPIIGSESEQYLCNCSCKAARIFIGSPTLLPLPDLRASFQKYSFPRSSQWSARYAGDA